MAPCASLALHRPATMATKPTASLSTHAFAITSITSPNVTVAPAVTAAQCVVPPGC